MHSKINISQLQEEIRLRPPHMITPEELRPGGGATAADSANPQAHFTLGRDIIDFVKRYIYCIILYEELFLPHVHFFCPYTRANYFAVSSVIEKKNLPTLKFAHCPFLSNWKEKIAYC